MSVTEILPYNESYCQLHIGYLEKIVVINTFRTCVTISQQSPQNRWLREEPFKTYFNDLINSKKFKERGIFNVKNLENAWSEFLSNKSETSFFIWQVSSTEQWFETFIDK